MRYFFSNIHKFLPHIILCGAILLHGSSFAAGVTGIGGTARELSSNSIIKPNGSDFFTVLRNILIDIIKTARVVLNGVALLAMLYVGMIFVTSMGDEEKNADGRYRILLIMVGLFIVNVAELVYMIITGSSYLDDDFNRKVTTVSTRDPGGTFSESSLSTCNYFFCPQNLWGNGSVIAIMKFFEVIMIATAVTMFSWAGFSLMLRGNNENLTKETKMRVIYGAMALVVVGFMESLYRAIFFGGTLNAMGIMLVLVNIANFCLFLAGPIALVCIITGAYWYITAAGDEERAERGKKIILYTFIGTILLILSYTFLIEIIRLNI